MLARLTPLVVVVNTLGRDGPFLEVIEQVRAGAPRDKFAARYTRTAPRGGGRARVGRPRRFMRELIERAAAHDSLSPQLAVFALGAAATFTAAPRAATDPKQWPHAKRHLDAALMLARLGADQCVRCGRELHSDWQDRYCEDHRPQRWLSVNGKLRDLGDQERSDREAVAAVLNGAADALGTP